MARPALVVLLLAWLGSVLAAQAPDRAETELELAGREVFRFRAERSGYSPEQRRTAANALLRELLEAGVGGSVTRSPFAEGEMLLLGGHEVFAVLTADVDSLAGETLETLAAETAARLEQAVAELHEAGSLEALLWAVGKSILTLAVGALLVWGLVRNHRRLSARVARFGAQKLARGTGGSRYLWQQNLVSGAHGCVALFTWGLVALVAFLTFERLLLYFPYSRPVGEELEGQLLEELRDLALALVESLPGLAVATVVWLLARFAVGMVRRYFQAAGRGLVHSHLAEAMTPLVAERLVAALVWLGALVVAFPYIPGSSTGAFQGVTVFAGLMVSLGSTSLIGQMASGIVLAYSRAFRVGDYVRFGEHEGTVVGFSLLATKLRTPRNDEVSVPNSLFTAGTTVNYSRFSEEGAFLATKLSLGYDIPWRTVHELLLGAARRTEGLRAEPAPYVLQTSLSDFYIEYELRAAVLEPARRPTVLSELHANVLDDFDAAGVAILSPHHTHLHGSVSAPGRAPGS
ncbi:MAG TPA: mechanosensitive ion channel family protein [Planctomycetota bacterium]